MAAIVTASRSAVGTGRAQRLPAPAYRPVSAVLVVLAAVLAAFAGRYGYHRDELYFRVAAEHLAWGYVDQPPLTPVLARLGLEAFGDSLVGLRVPAILLAVGSVALVALVARELGGGTAAQVLSAGAAAGSALVLALGHQLSTAGPDLLLWLLLSLLALRLLRTADPRWFVPLGLVVGVGLLNKYLIALPVIGLLLAVLAVGPRQVLRSRWLAVGALLALAVAAPNLWWQAGHGWPQVEVATGLAADEGAENRALFVPLQLVYLSPLLAPLWVAGLLRLARAPELRWARPFAVAYGVVFVLVLALGGKAYYVVPLLLVLLAAGAPVAIRRVPVRVLVATVAVAAAVNVVGSLPVLPPAALGPVNAMNGEQGEQLGWPQLAETVAGAWDRIPAAERGRAVIYTTNYGEAGAVDRYGPAYGLPTAYSGHMSFADWGPPPDEMTGPVVIVAHERNRAANTYFTGCTAVAVLDDGYDFDHGEQGISVLLCDGTTAPWSELWPSLRHTG